jgi:transcriptional regulator with XRE-family HTH domain
VTGDWQALADHIRAERNRRGWTQDDLARAAGISSTKTVWDLETGRSRRRIPGSAQSVEKAFGWPAGTARRIVFEQDAPGPTVDEPAPIDEEYARPLDQYRRLVLNLVDDRDEQLRLLAKIDAAEREIAEMEEEIREAQDRSA